MKTSHHGLTLKRLHNDSAILFLHVIDIIIISLILWNNSYTYVFFNPLTFTRASFDITSGPGERHYTVHDLYNAIVPIFCKALQ